MVRRSAGRRSITIKLNTREKIEENNTRLIFTELDIVLPKYARIPRIMIQELRNETRDSPAFSRRVNPGSNVKIQEYSLLESFAINHLHISFISQRITN